MEIKNYHPVLLTWEMHSTSTANTVVFCQEIVHLTLPRRCRGTRTLPAALEGHLFCAERAAAITERSIWPHGGKSLYHSAVLPAIIPLKYHES